MRAKLSKFWSKPAFAQIVQVVLLAAFLATVLIVSLTINQNDAASLKRGVALVALFSAALKGISLGVKYLPGFWHAEPVTALAHTGSVAPATLIEEIVVEEPSTVLSADGAYTFIGGKTTIRKFSS